MKFQQVVIVNDRCPAPIQSPPHQFKNVRNGWWTFKLLLRRYCEIEKKDWARTNHQNCHQLTKWSAMKSSLKTALWLFKSILKLEIYLSDLDKLFTEQNFPTWKQHQRNKLKSGHEKDEKRSLEWILWKADKWLMKVEFLFGIVLNHNRSDKFENIFWAFWFTSSH